MIAISHELIPLIIQLCHMTYFILTAFAANLKHYQIFLFEYMITRAIAMLFLVLIQTKADMLSYHIFLSNYLLKHLFLPKISQ